MVLKELLLNYLALLLEFKIMKWVNFSLAEKAMKSIPGFQLALPLAKNGLLEVDTPSKHILAPVDTMMTSMKLEIIQGGTLSLVLRLEEDSNSLLQPIFDV